MDLKKYFITKSQTTRVDDCPADKPCKSGITCFAPGVYNTTTPNLQMQCNQDGSWTKIQTLLKTKNSCDPFYYQNNAQSCQLGDVTENYGCNIKCYCQGSGSYLRYNCYDITNGQQGVLYTPSN